MTNDTPDPAVGRTAYLDCFAGISGDMLTGALLDAGAELEELREFLARLPLDNYRLAVEQVERQGLTASRFLVTVTGPQPHRSWPAIREMLDASALPTGVKTVALQVFERLATAEARVHGTSVEQIHFHEVGGVDSIVDIVATAGGLHLLGVERLVCSPLPLGRGWVRCAHGPLPLPAPAVCELLQGMPVYGVEAEEELVTPTGAGMVRVLVDRFGPLPAMRIEAVGYGAGSRPATMGRPNLLRLFLGREVTPVESQEVEVIETHLDDWSPEAFPYLCDQLLAMGALDVALIPMQMKKGRPGFLLRVITDPARGLAVKQRIFSETTTIGLRYRREQRWTLPRQEGTIATPWGALQVKRVETPAGPVLYPEYEACRRLAETRQVPLKDVYQAVRNHCLADFTPTGEKPHG